MELVIGENGAAPKPITNADREAVRAQRKKHQVAPVVKPKAGPFLELATPVAVNKLWPWINDGLIRLKKKDKHSDTWTPQHVRAYVERGFRGDPVQLWFVKDRDKPAVDEQPIGFFIISAFADTYMNVPFTAWLWIVVGNSFVALAPENRGNPWMVLKKKDLRLFRAVVKEIATQARNLGLARIRWGTSRMGWAPIARALGFEPVQIIWEMKV